MDVKKKLVELIYQNSPRLVEEEAEILANRLIASGVTVQEYYMSLEKAITRLKHHYGRALKLEFVYNKLGWALFQTWKEFD